MVDTHLVSLEHSRIKTRDLPILMMEEQPKLLEITITATHIECETCRVGGASKLNHIGGKTGVATLDLHRAIRDAFR